MFLYLRVFCCGLVMIITGCATNQAFIKQTQERKVCIAACQQQLSVCQQTCDNSCQKCCAKSNQSTVSHYYQYKERQRIQGAGITRDLNSYRDPLQCRKTTCECIVDYQVCTQSCSGKLPKRLHEVLVC